MNALDTEIPARMCLNIALVSFRAMNIAFELLSAGKQVPPVLLEDRGATPSRTRAVHREAMRLGPQPIH